jgi:hypothetical protein
LTLTYVEALIRALFVPRQKRQNPQPVAGYSANCQAEVDPALCVNEKTTRSLGECVKHIEREVTEMVSDPVAVLWMGEVMFNRGPGGISSPLYALEAAAEAWALGSALRLHAMGVCSAQVVCWHCAAPLAAQALEKGDDEFDRLRGYFVSPIRSHEILPVWLPGVILENDVREKVG